MTESERFEGLVQDLAARCRREAPGDPAGWRRLAEVEILGPALDGAGTPPAFLAWARDHRRFGYVVAECAAEVCAKPREAAIYVLGAIVAELAEES